jgi:hypothetical protein
VDVAAGGAFSDGDESAGVVADVGLVGGGAPPTTAPLRCSTRCRRSAAARSAPADPPPVCGTVASCAPAGAAGTATATNASTTATDKDSKTTHTQTLATTPKPPSPPLLTPRTLIGPVGQVNTFVSRQD